MEITLKNCKVREIDKFVKNFVDILEKYGRYVIVSGYMAIFCCRERPTQDVDIIFEPFKDIEKLKVELKNKYDVHIDENVLKYKDPFYVFTDFYYGGYNLYFEIKFPRNVFDRIALNNRILLRKQEISMYFSPIELQIAYKVWLGGDKDILDACYLLELFRKYINEKDLFVMARLLDVEEEVKKIWES